LRCQELWRRGEVPTSNHRGEVFAGSVIRESALIFLVFWLSGFELGPDSGRRGDTSSAREHIAGYRACEEVWFALRITASNKKGIKRA
jgi:hypothetical protein